MAKYSDFIAGLVEGDYGNTGPAGLTSRFDVGVAVDLIVSADVDAPSGKKLNITHNGSTVRSFFSIDAINADPDRGTCTTVMLIRVNSPSSGGTATYGGIGSRGNGDGSSETLAASNIARNSSDQRVTRAISYTSGSASTTDSSATNIWVQGEIYLLKQIVSGTTMTTELYNFGDYVTSINSFSRSCPASNANNWIGVFSFASQTDIDILYMAVGTGADQPDLPPTVIDPPETAPGNPSATGNSSSTITLNYDAVSGATGYEYELDGGTPVDVGNDLMPQVTDLTALTQYDFRVRAYNSGGAGPWSAIFTGTTLAVGTNIVLITEFDAGNVSQTLTTIINPSSNEPRIEIKFRPEAITGTNGSGWTIGSLAVSDADGKRPVFSLPRADLFTASASISLDYLPMWTQDFVNFTQAPSRSLVGGSSGTIEFQFTDPLPAGTVYILTHPIGQQAAAAPYAASLLANYPSIVSPLPSADVDGVYFTSPAEVDENGRQIGGHYMYALKLAFGGSTTDGGPKRKAVISYGQHAMGEAQAWWAFKSFLDYILNSTDAEAVRDRADFDYYVYFNITPNGIFGGHRRHNIARSTDPNRDWVASPVLAEIAATKAAITSDTGGSINVCFDFHGASSRQESFIVFAPPSAKTTRFVELGELVFGETAYTDITNITGSMADFCVNELSADFASATEMQGRGDTSLANYQSIGVNWAKTLAAADADGMFYEAPANEYTAGAETSFAVESDGGALLSVSSGASSGFNPSVSGGASSLANAGSSVGFDLAASGGSLLSVLAGGEAGFTVTSSGGAEVQSAPEPGFYTGGAQSPFSVAAVGGASVIVNVGGGAQFAISAIGGATTGGDGVIIGVITMPVSAIQYRVTA